MGSMTDERRKEMEEEMMRFEQEIFTFPVDNEDNAGSKKVTKMSKSDNLSENSRKRKMSPPAMPDILPKVLAEPPPPPPPPTLVTTSSSSSPPPSRQHGPLPPPPIPHMRDFEDRNRMQFIPHQLQRHPPRPPHPPRPNFSMRGHHGFNQGPMPFPPMQGPMPGQMQGPMPGQMQGPMPGQMQGPMPGQMQGPMHHPMSLPPMSMPPMGMPMPMPPGFAPPPPPPPMHNMPPQQFMASQMPIPFREPVPAQTNVRKERKPEPSITSAPAVYAAPPMKSFSEKIIEISTSSNGPSITVTTTVPIVMHKLEEVLQPRANEEPSVPISVAGPIVPEPVISKKKEKKKKLIRMAGGQAWEDNSLIEWDTDDFRIFCGDLGNDVTDEVLIRAFSKYTSFVKAKVIRDKRTNKTKGYGFVSFKDPQDFIKAMREMNGRYVGSRPIKLRKSTWKDRNIDIVRKKQKEKEKLGLL